MTAVIVEVGPHTIRGPGAVDREICRAAVEFIDDPLILVDEQPVVADVLWRGVLRAAVGAGAGPLALVLPTWWPSGRVGVVTRAAEQEFPDVVVLRRSLLVPGSGTAVLELSADHVVVTAAGSDPAVLSRDGPGVLARLQNASAVLVDVPAGVAPPPHDIVARLRQLGIPFTYSSSRELREAVAALVEDISPGDAGARWPRPGRRAVAVLGGVAVTAAAVGGGWAAHPVPSQNGEAVTRQLVEGRVALQVPADWAVERVTGGTGSERVRVSAAGGLPALNITQSVGAAEMTLGTVAETLRRSLQFERPGVFTDLNATADVGGRPAVTYVERRTDSETHWAVLVDGPVRIAIGCQYPPHRRDTATVVCADAVRSARVVQ